MIENLIENLFDQFETVNLAGEHERIPKLVDNDTIYSLGEANKQLFYNSMSQCQHDI